MGFGRPGKVSDVRKAILERIEDGDGDPVPVGDVVQRATLHAGSPSTVGTVLSELHKAGEIYEPKPAHLKRTSDGGQ